MVVIMVCKDVQQKFIPFIDDQLSIRDLDAFLQHIDTCDECREEYDVYYTMIMGMRYLDEEETGVQFKIDSGQKLRSAADYLMKYRILRIEKLLLFGVICMGVVLLF